MSARKEIEFEWWKLNGLKNFLVGQQLPGTKQIIYVSVTSLNPVRPDLKEHAMLLLRIRDSEPGIFSPRTYEVSITNLDPDMAQCTIQSPETIEGIQTLVHEYLL